MPRALLLRPMGYLTLILVVGHLVILGLKGWLAPKGWQAGIPPISLVAVSVALVPLLVKRRLIREKQKRKERSQ